MTRSTALALFALCQTACVAIDAGSPGASRVLVDVPFEAVRFDVDAGDLEVRQGDVEVPELVRTVRCGGATPDVRSWIEGPVLVLSAECPRPLDCAVDHALVVPWPVEVTGRVGAGNARFRGARGLSFEIGAGNLRGDALQGDEVSAASGAGNVELSFDRAPLDVYAETGAGNVTIVLAPGAYEVDAHTGLGQVSIDVADDGSAPARVVATTGVGNVIVSGR